MQWDKALKREIAKQIVDCAPSTVPLSDCEPLPLPLPDVAGPCSTCSTLSPRDAVTPDGDDSASDESDSVGLDAAADDNDSGILGIQQESEGEM